MKIFDCCIYLDEDFILNLRFNILNDFVDYFVVVESNKTWQNNEKKLNFNIKNFDKFCHKINLKYSIENVGWHFCNL